MKRLFTLLAITVLLVSSCTKDQAKDAADDYVGNYSCTTTMFGDFVITKVDANSILIKEVGSNPWTVVATVNGETLAIAAQNVSGWQTSGVGTRSGSTIAFVIEETDGHSGGGYHFAILKK